MNEGDAKTGSPKLFTCPNEGCIRVYKRYGSMVNHVAYGKCEFEPERESLLDTAKIMYSSGAVRSVKRWALLVLLLQLFH